MESSTEKDVRDDSGVTVTITVRVRSGREPDFEQFLQGINEAVSGFPGFVGVRVFRPSRGNGHFRTVLRFSSTQGLWSWMESEEREVWHARAVDLAEGEPIVEDITGTSQDRPLAMALAPLGGFVRTSISGIGLLLLGAVAALALANSPLSDRYATFWATELTVGVGDYGITETLRHWVNDGLMALFFFIVGLEIKREILVGELRSLRRATLPIAAALGGAVAPALVYLVINLNGDAMDGWGVPIGTDTAFALGIMSLFAARVRPILLVFLTAFAIVDDILAVLVIAVFYTDTVTWSYLGVAAALLVALVVANAAGFHRWPVYAALGMGVWLAIFASGVHGTLAGILVAMTVPARSWINPSAFLVRSRQLIDDFERACFVAPTILTNEEQQQATQALEQLVEDVETPMTHLQHRLNPWVAFGVLPIFALANAGIELTGTLGDALASPVTWGVTAGLVLGKPLGITLFSWLAVRTGITVLPAAIEWRDIFGVALLGGIGFTMSLFISELAFGAGPVGDAARIGILIGSVVAGVVGYFALKKTLPRAGEVAEA